MSSPCPKGFHAAPPGWKLRGTTFLGPKSSGSFPTLEEAAFWANTLGGQCGGIQFNPKYGYMLTYGHQLIAADDHQGALCWTKGSKHTPEPAYPYQRNGWKRFQRDVEQHKTMGKPFSRQFSRLFLNDEWIKRGKEDFSESVQHLYSKKSMPGMVQKATEIAATAAESAAAAAISMFSLGKGWVIEKWTQGGGRGGEDEEAIDEWILVEETEADIHQADEPDELVERLERLKAMQGHLHPGTLEKLRALKDPVDRALAKRLCDLYGVEYTE